jgi:hypothetical protein
VVYDPESRSTSPDFPLDAYPQLALFYPELTSAGSFDPVTFLVTTLPGLGHCRRVFHYDAEKKLKGFVEQGTEGATRE